jgi:nitrogenase molybdenum-cofactor synthesis protein NifE
MKNIRELYCDKAFFDIYPVHQLRRYGMNCKLSGSVTAVGELEGVIPLVHGPKGCVFHQRLTPQRMYRPVYDLECTDLREKEVVYGGEERLKEKVWKVYDRYHPSMIVILPTCVAGIIGDDINGVIAELREEIPCKLVVVESEGFAHLDRQSLDIMLKDYAKVWQNPTLSPSYKLRGSGFTEVMCAFVDQVMEKQKITPYSVNIESFGRWGYGYKTELEEIKRIFEQIGITVNATLPNCTVEDLIRVPQGQLNIVRRGIGWAELMKEKFGTKYLRYLYYYYGVDGTEKFFLDVAKQLDLEEKARPVIDKEKKCVLEKLKEYQVFFRKKSYALVTQGFFYTPSLINIYARDYQIPLKYVCVEMRWLRGNNITPETADLMLDNIKEALQKWEIGAELIIDPTVSELREIAQDVDYVLGNRNAIYEGQGIKIVNTIDQFTRIGFEAILESAKHLAKQIQQKKESRDPLIAKLKYHEEYYPMLDNQNCLASYEMWKSMWGSRG